MDFGWLEVVFLRRLDQAFQKSILDSRANLMIRPFDYSAITRDANGIARYDTLLSSLVEMLRATVDNSPDHEALVELGGGRVTYRELWDRSARVAGGLKQLGIKRGDRVAIRLGNGLDWCFGFFGAQMAGAVAVPVNTRFSE